MHELNSNRSNELDELLKTARHHFDHGDYQLAESCLQEFVSERPNNADAYFMLGTIDYDRGRFTKAITRFRRSIQLRPHFIEPSLGLSILLNDLGRYDEAKKVFDDAKKALSKPDDNNAYILEKMALKHEEIADLYFQHKLYEEAYSEYEKAFNLKKRKPETYLKMVECRVEQEDDSAAESGFRTLTGRYPHFIQGYLRWGLYLYKSGRILEAIEQWEYVLGKDPENSQARRYIEIAQAASKNNLLGPTE